MLVYFRRTPQEQICHGMPTSVRHVDAEGQESPNEVDWELHAWTEVSLDSFKDLSDQLKESFVVL